MCKSLSTCVIIIQIYVITSWRPRQQDIRLWFAPVCTRCPSQYNTYSKMSIFRHKIASASRPFHQYPQILIVGQKHHDISLWLWSIASIIFSLYVHAQYALSVNGFFYFYWITPSATWAVLPRGPARVIPHGSSVTTGGNRSTRRKPAMFGRVKLDNTLLTCDHGNFNRTTQQNRNPT